MTAAAVVIVVLLVITTLFQLALVLGAPLGSAAWGGRNPGVLPGRLRIASGAALLVYPLMMLYVLASAGLIEVPWLPIGKVGMWVLVGFFALGALANFASPSKVERIWGPVSLVMGICAAIIAVGM